MPASANRASDEARREDEAEVLQGQQQSRQGESDAGGGAGEQNRTRRVGQGKAASGGGCALQVEGRVDAGVPLGVGLETLRKRVDEEARRLGQVPGCVDGVFLGSEADGAGQALVVLSVRESAVEGPMGEDDAVPRVGEQEGCPE